MASGGSGPRRRQQTPGKTRRAAENTALYSTIQYSTPPDRAKLQAIAPTAVVQPQETARGGSGHPRSGGKEDRRRREVDEASQPSEAGRWAGPTTRDVIAKEAGRVR